MDLKPDQKLHVVDESGSASSSSIPLPSAGPSMSGSSNSSAPPPNSMNAEQEAIHLPPQAALAPDSADLISPVLSEYSLFSESPIKPLATIDIGSDRPAGTQGNNNTTLGTDGLPAGYSNSVPAATGMNTVVQPRSATLPDVTLAAHPPSQAGMGMPGSTGSTDELPVSSPQPLSGTNTNAAMQGTIGVPRIHSPLLPTPNSIESFDHGVSLPINTSISNPLQPYVQAQAPLQHVDMNPLLLIPQQQQNLVTIASPPSHVLPTESRLGNMAPGPQPPPLPARPPQHPQYTALAAYTPPSVSVPDLLQRPPLHPGTSLPILPSQLPQLQLAQSSLSDTLSHTPSPLKFSPSHASQVLSSSNEELAKTITYEAPTSANNHIEAKLSIDKLVHPHPRPRPTPIYMRPGEASTISPPRPTFDGSGLESVEKIWLRHHYPLYLDVQGSSAAKIAFLERVAGEFLKEFPSHVPRHEGSRYDQAHALKCAKKSIIPRIYSHFKALGRGARL
ncbi:hypothetical protein GYMLUDRAFT_247690 [Collybiopsis luxurians FD-317 M1]|uniref:Uncharacterized protein n=1 Tax=Collybiopsis luxurians FD-317 M1 TaxID=944289 RepID=A0A0D0CN27_9AGAR|nr:hypothetical protein GYMLUDRAFT_247690 [Collybiopsis luxurians FD-317 M1]